jgi:hypothetical protein
VKNALRFYFDHTPGMDLGAVWPFLHARNPPLPGWNRYSVTVQFDDGSMNVESVCLDGEPKSTVVLTLDGSAKYEWDERDRER